MVIILRPAMPINNIRKLIQCVIDVRTASEDDRLVLTDRGSHHTIRVTRVTHVYRADRQISIFKSVVKHKTVRIRNVLPNAYDFQTLFVLNFLS